MNRQPPAVGERVAHGRHRQKLFCRAQANRVLCSPVVVACTNEETAFPETNLRVLAALGEISPDFEIAYVDDARVEAMDLLCSFAGRPCG